MKTAHQPKLAKALDPQELLNRSLSTDQTTVPKLFHQSWADNDLPEKFREWSEICRAVHPDWEWVLWTNKDNHDLVEKFAPWLLETYESLVAEIFRADMARNIYMHVFGGVYADLDIECLRPTEQLLDEYHIEGRKVYLGRMGTDPDHGQSIPNAWMTSTPAHPFWLLPLQWVERNKRNDMQAELLTGPGSLHEAVRQHEREYQGAGNDSLDRHYMKSEWRDLYIPARGVPQSVYVLPYWNIYPYSWLNNRETFQQFCSPYAGDTFNATKCKELTATDHWGEHGSYTISYWSHSWDDQEGKTHDWDKMEGLKKSNAEGSTVEGKG
ncbi:MAG: hypothetical protein Q9217_004109 [Psora testacea]